MSEYQYYEFLAIDKALTVEQQNELHNISTRGEISSRHFVNEYDWGYLKADPVDWMREYFDAHVYFANWYTQSLMLAFDSNDVDLQQMHSYQSESFWFDDFSDSDGRVVLRWYLEGGAGGIDDCETGRGWMAQLAPLRDEILAGDMRSLFLGWLADYGREFDYVEADDWTCPVPDGLSQLTAAQLSLVQFLGVDQDWLAAAAEISQPIGQSDRNSQMQEWPQEQPTNFSQAAVLQILQGDTNTVSRRLQSDFTRWLTNRNKSEQALPQLDYLALQTRAAEHQQQREQRERIEEAQRQEQARIAREAMLRELAKRADAQWQSIQSLLGKAKASSYDQAQQALKDLYAAMLLEGRQADIQRWIGADLQDNRRTSAWQRRLREAGISI